MNIDFRFYWTLFLRRLPVMAALFLFCAGIGIALAIKLPTTYTSTATLRVDQAQIAGGGTGLETGRGKLDEIRRDLLTRANLVTIANEKNAFGKNSDSMTAEQKIDAMREATKIEITGGGRNQPPPYMTISFSTGNNRTAYDVVLEYVERIQAAGLEDRQDWVARNLRFNDGIVETLEDRLKTSSKGIAKFKSDNADALPSNLNSNRNRAVALEERIVSKEGQMEADIEQRQMFVAFFEQTGRIPNQPQQNLSPIEQQLAKLQAELESLLLVYSETSPKVRVVQAQVAKVESQMAANRVNAGGNEGSTQEAAYNQILAGADDKIAELATSIEKDKATLKALNASIAATPANEIELNGLQREYDNIRSQYASAIGRRDQAQFSELVEESGSGSKIELQEAPRIPNRPSSLSSPLIAMGGIGAGIAAMAALFLLLEVLNNTIRRPVELTKSLGITPLATIPYMETRRHFWVRRSLKLALLLAVIIAVPAGLWVLDGYYPLDIIFNRLLSQLGL